MGLKHKYAAMAARSAGKSLGESATLRRTVPGVYDPVAGTTGTNTVTDYPVNPVPVTPEEAGLQDASVIGKGERLVGVAAIELTITPDAETDTMVYGSDVWQIKAVKVKRAGDTLVSYIFLLRQ